MPYLARVVVHRLGKHLSEIDMVVPTGDKEVVKAEYFGRAARRVEGKLEQSKLKDYSISMVKSIREIKGL